MIYIGNYLIPYPNGNFTIPAFRMESASDTTYHYAIAETITNSMWSYWNYDSDTVYTSGDIQLNESISIRESSSAHNIYINNSYEMKFSDKAIRNDCMVGSCAIAFYENRVFWGTNIHRKPTATPPNISFMFTFTPSTGYAGLFNRTYNRDNYATNFSEVTNSTIKNFLLNIQPEPPSDTDPFAPGGSSDSGGGDGDFTPHGDDITDPAIPDVDAVSTGFITLFNPSVSELNSLASYMWSGGFDVNTFKKLFANPMDCILGLSILPKIVPNGGSATVLVGNISTGVTMTKAARQYIKYDCGSITISRFSNSFLDYEPYTKIHLYLPFIGMHQISTDDVMNKTVQVKYTVDILSGACVAFVIAGGTTLYTFIGQCAASVPITGQDWSTMINGVLGAVGSIASVAGSIATGNVAGAIGGAASMAQNVINSKPSVEHSGNMGGMGGMLGIKTPYIIIERPAQAIPANQNAFIGYPSFVTKNFSDLQGYNEVYSTHLENIPATEAELNEIESLLKSGVIF